MASSFGARRSENVDALLTQAVEFVGVDAGEENLSIAHNYCLYHAKHHSFPTRIRARFAARSTPSASASASTLSWTSSARSTCSSDASIVVRGPRTFRTHARVLQLLLGLSRSSSPSTRTSTPRPLSGRTTASARRGTGSRLDGDRDLLAALAAWAWAAPPPSSTTTTTTTTTSARTRARLDPAASRDGRSDSTLSDWTDDEAEDARVGALRRDVAAAADAARCDACSTSAASWDPASLEPESPRPRRRPRLLVVQTRRDVGRRRERPATALATAKGDKKRENDRDDPTAAAIAAAAAAATTQWRRRGGGAAGPRLYPRGRQGAKVSAANLPGSRRLARRLARWATPPRAPGPRGPRAVPSSAASSPRRWKGDASREAAASALDDAAAAADVVLHPARSAVANGFETRADDASVRDGVGDDARVSRRFGAGAAAAERGAGAPTLLEVRARVSAVAERARALASPRAPRFPRLRTVTPSAAASRCLTALAARRGVATSRRRGVRRGATRVSARAGEPYLAATHAWIEEGAGRRRRGVFRVEEGEARGAKIGTEANRERGFELRRGRWANPSVPSFSRVR